MVCVGGGREGGEGGRREREEWEGGDGRQGFSTPPAGGSHACGGGCFHFVWGEGEGGAQAGASPHTHTLPSSMLSPRHCEDLDLYSVNYLHYGAPKHWYCIAPEHRQRFETLLKGLLPDMFKACPEFMRHKVRGDGGRREWRAGGREEREEGEGQMREGKARGQGRAGMAGPIYRLQPPHL